MPYEIEQTIDHVNDMWELVKEYNYDYSCS